MLLHWRALVAASADPIELSPIRWDARDIDGIAGPRTRAAVATFQRAWNALGLQRQISTRGELDDATLQSLRDDIDRRAK